MIIPVPPAPEADQVLEAEAEVQDTTRGQNLNIQDLDQGIDIDIIEKDLIQEDAILDQDLDLLLVKALDTKEKENDLIHPLDLVKKGPKATVPKLYREVILSEMISVPPPPHLPAMTTER